MTDIQELVKIVNGEIIPLTPEEVAEYYLEIAEFDADAFNRMVLEFSDSLQAKIDKTAQERSYSDGVSCASYKDSPNPQWSAEATAFIDWRDSAWSYAYTVEAEVQEGIIPAPTLQEFLDNVPAIAWPSISVK